MGKIRQGILGGVSGAVGNVVGSTWKGVNYLRIKADNYSDAKSERQVLHRARFTACVALAKFLLESVIRPIWNKKATKMSGRQDLLYGEYFRGEDAQSKNLFRFAHFEVLMFQSALMLRISSLKQ
jgi:hypothetical protein